MKIKTKDLTVEPLDLTTAFAWAQRQFAAKIQELYNAGKPIRIIVLKGRQVGISTVSEAVLLNWCFMHPGANSLVLSKSTSDSEYLFEMTKLMWDNWPYRTLFTESHKSVRRLAWNETGSSMKIATAKGQEVGRGQTIHAVHCSEVAFYPDPEGLMLSLKQAVPDKPGTIIILESTANGAGNWFHQEWFAAKHGESDFIPMFFPWFLHEEYSFPETTLTYDQLTKDERDMMRKFPELGLPQIAWRRWCIRNKCDNDVSKFQQEYPNDDHEAFLVTGRNIFPLDRLDECYEHREGSQGFISPIRDPTRPQGVFHKDTSERLTIFKHPHPSQKYVVAGDPTRTTWGDPACIQVVNRYTFEQVAVWHGHCEPVAFADRLAELGYYYNTATVNCEIEGGGLASVSILTSKMFYPNVWRYRQADRMPGQITNSFGWSMNWQRKQMAVSYVIDLLGQKMLKIHDEITYDQMANYVSLRYGELGPASEKGKDDAVTSLAIAVGTICLELESSRGRSPDEVFQSYTMELSGNVFSSPAPAGPPVADIGGAPFWEAMSDGMGYD
jgi:hypothetical protein